MLTLATRHPPHRGRRHNTLLPSEPGLIYLPTPLPSIPVLDPILTPLIQGANFRSSPTTAQPAASPPPGETQTAVDPSPTNAGGGVETGGDPGSGNEGSSGGDSGQPMDTVSTQSGPTGGGDGQNGESGGVTGTSPRVIQTLSSITGSVSVVPTLSSSSPSNGGNLLANGNTPESDSSGSNSSGGSASGSASVGSGNGNENGNRGSDSRNDDSTRTGVSIDIPGMTGTPSTTIVDSGTSGGRGSGNGNGNTVGTGAEQKHGLSGGAIGGIVVAVLLFAVAVTVILLRRHFKSRRTERRKLWWVSRDGTAQAYGDRNAGVGSSGGVVGLDKGERKSVRSSFETTVDRSASPHLGEELGIPSIPPMAELRGAPLLDHSVGPGALSRSPDVKSKTTPEKRFSAGTVSSTGSDGQGQWLIINRDRFAPEVSSPMSVRPFSPTESFAFPKPPTEKSSGDWGSHFSRPTSLHTLNIKNHGIGASIAEEEVPTLPVPSPAANPFNGPDPIALYSSAVAALGITPGNPEALAEIDVAAANNLANPFADPDPSTPSPVNPGFMEIEMIKRPFIPSLDDELAVDPGDKVRILQLFDDGWAMVEKNPSHGLASVKGKGRASEKGLIPVDCFRDHGVDLSAFITSKRVSGYSQSSGNHAVSEEAL